MDETNGNTEAELSFDPELFRYEAFTEGGLTSALRALEKLSRLANLAQRGIRASGAVCGRRCPDDRAHRGRGERRERGAP